MMFSCRNAAPRLVRICHTCPSASETILPEAPYTSSSSFFRSFELQRLLLPRSYIDFLRQASDHLLSKAPNARYEIGSFAERDLGSFSPKRTISARSGLLATFHALFWVSRRWTLLGTMRYHREIGLSPLPRSCILSFGSNQRSEKRRSTRLTAVRFRSSHQSSSFLLRSQTQGHWRCCSSLVERVQSGARQAVVMRQTLMAFLHCRGRNEFFFSSEPKACALLSRLCSVLPYKSLSFALLQVDPKAIAAGTQHWNERAPLLSWSVTVIRNASRALRNPLQHGLIHFSSLFGVSSRRLHACLVPHWRAS